MVRKVTHVITRTVLIVLIVLTWIICITCIIRVGIVLKDKLTTSYRHETSKNYFKSSKTYNGIISNEIGLHKFI